MKRITVLAIFTILTGILSAQIPSVLVEAESFDEKGGWVVDQQFIPSMGSPYLLAHGKTFKVHADGYNFLPRFNLLTGKSILKHLV